jgi:hypothetical protein
MKAIKSADELPADFGSIEGCCPDIRDTRIAELEAELDERLAAVQLCDIYYKIGCDALGQDEWDRRVRESLTE